LKQRKRSERAGHVDGRIASRGSVVVPMNAADRSRMKRKGCRLLAEAFGDMGSTSREVQEGRSAPTS
jgi:hypothetical protein